MAHSVRKRAIPTCLGCTCCPFATQQGAFRTTVLLPVTRLPLRARTNLHVQDVAAYALIVLSYLLEHQSTLYLVSWAKPLGLTKLRLVIKGALDRLESWGVSPASMLGSAIGSVYDFMHGPEFKDLQAVVRLHHERHL
jgi:hypothetical protein